MRILLCSLFLISTYCCHAQFSADQSAATATAARSASIETLRLTVRAMIADGANDFVKYIGDQMPKKTFEKDNEKSWWYKLSVGAKNEKLKYDPMFESTDLRLYFGNDGEQLAQSAKVKLVMDTMSARFERTPGITVERKAGTVRVKKGELTIYYYNQNDKGELTGLYIHSTSPAAKAADERMRKSFEANQANPAVKESMARINFLMSSSSSRNIGNMGVTGLLNQYKEALKAPGADPDAVKSAYQKKLSAEITLLENNYTAWENFIATAKTISAKMIAEDKSSIEYEKKYVAEMKEKLKAVFK